MPTDDYRRMDELDRKLEAGELTPEAHDWATGRIADRVVERATREDYHQSMAEAAEDQGAAALEEFRKSQE